MADTDHQDPSLERQARTVSHLSEIDKAAWDRLANPPDQPYNPMLSYDFLEALEASGSVGANTGWAPRHVVLEQGSEIIAAAPMYAKGHSQGEYIFDHAWADAFERAGGRYYPKLLVAIPFTPATGRRLLAPDLQTRLQLATALRQLTTHFEVSSLHVNFLDKDDLNAFTEVGFLQRNGQQFHFENKGYTDFEDFLSALASRKRKNLRKERASALADDIEIEWITGSDIKERHIEIFWQFYQDTGARKWGTPYLTYNFFQLLIERQSQDVLFIMAKRGDQYIAGAMNLIGGDTLYGRYWGTVEHVPFLHFEVCYYQAIDFALAHGLNRVEAGAQGEHKIARGYEPCLTYSAHYLPDPGFHTAVEHYLHSERGHVEADLEILSDFTPFKKSPQ